MCHVVVLSPSFCSTTSTRRRARSRGIRPPRSSESVARSLCVHSTAPQFPGARYHQWHGPVLAVIRGYFPVLATMSGSPGARCHQGHFPVLAVVSGTFRCSPSFPMRAATITDCGIAAVLVSFFPSDWLLFHSDVCNDCSKPVSFRISYTFYIFYITFFLCYFLYRSALRYDPCVCSWVSY